MPETPSKPGLRNRLLGLGRADHVEAAETINVLMSYDRDQFVECCYLTFLHRQPDAEGLQSYRQALKKGATKVDVAFNIARSPEAHDRGMSGGTLAREVLQLKLDELITNAKIDISMRSVLELAKEQLSFETYETPVPSAPLVGLTIKRRPPSVFVRRSADAPFSPSGAPDEPSIWFDLTAVMQWDGRNSDLLRTELEFARGLHAVNPAVRYSVQVETGFAEIQTSDLAWLLGASNVVDAYMTFFGRYRGQDALGRAVSVVIPEGKGLYHPFSANDVVISAGSVNGRREALLSRLKGEIPELYLAYTVVVAPTPETTHLRSEGDRRQLRNYLEWVSRNCDFVFYATETVKRDTEALQVASGWPWVPGAVVRLGGDIVKPTPAESDEAVLERLGIAGRFILSVGDIDPRGNQDTIYRAFRMALEPGLETTPKLVICGRAGYRSDNIVDVMDRDPRVAGALIRVVPTDLELDVLYRNCLFTLQPNLSDGWNPALFDSLGYGKFSIAADTPSMRECAGDLAEYVAPFDVRGWADQILFYSREAGALASRSERVAAEWKPARWVDASWTVNAVLDDFRKKYPPTGQRLVGLHVEPAVKPTIWFDMTITYMQWTGGVSGTIRAELTFAYLLKKLAPDTRFFAWVDHPEGGYFFEIQQGYLAWLFDATDLPAAYKSFRMFWDEREAAGLDFRNPFHGKRPSPGHASYLPQFPDDSIVFFAGVDIGVKRTGDVLGLVSRQRRVLVTQLLYDFTPFIVPQFHIPDLPPAYVPFFDFVSNHFDYLIYGGRTAQRDGTLIQQKSGARTPPSDFIEFGSDIAISGPADPAAGAPVDDKKVLAELGVTSKFVMTVGTIEPRKNHEMLYKAYLHLLERDQLKVPLQMIFVGNKGWKSEDFMETFRNDERIRDKVLILNPTDQQLDVLYKNCAFTLLPSFYEGWSLTLPESLSYGKFCLTSDVDPLRETGRDLVEYINPMDTYAWAERIEYYANNPKEVTKRNALIKKGWKAKTWEECTEDLIAMLYRAHGAIIHSAENE